MASHSSLSTRRSHRPKRNEPSAVEVLEARIAPAFTPTYMGTVSRILTLTGTAGNDTATFVLVDPLTLKITNVTPDTTTQMVDLTGVNFITVLGSTGDDVVTVDLSGGDMATSGRRFGFSAGGNPGDMLKIVGTGTQSASWTPSSAGAGTIDISSGNYLCAGMPGGIGLSKFAAASMTSPLFADDYTLNGSSVTSIALGEKLSLVNVSSLTIDFGFANPSRNDTFTLSGLPAGMTSLSILLGGGDDKLQVSGINSFAGVAINVDGGAGTDTFAISANRDMTLANGGLTLSGATLNLGNSFEVANLTGGSNQNTLEVTGWTGAGKLTGGSNGAIVRASNDVALYSLSDTSLGRTGFPAMTLAGVTLADVRGGVGNNVFDVSGWTGGGTLTGGGGNDTLRATGLSDLSALSDRHFMANILTIVYGLDLSGLSNAELVGDPSQSADFYMDGWTGSASLSNGTFESLDNPHSLILTSASLSREGRGAINLSNIHDPLIAGRGIIDISAWPGSIDVSGDGIDTKLIVSGEGYAAYDLSTPFESSDLTLFDSGGIARAYITSRGITLWDFTAAVASSRLTVANAFDAGLIFHGSGGNDELRLGYSLGVPATSSITFEGSGGADKLTLIGTYQPLTWSPSGATANTGGITYGNVTILYKNAPGGVAFDRLGTVTIRPGDGPSDYVFTSSLVIGASPAQQAAFTNVFGNYVVDLGGSDVAPARDTLRVSALPSRSNFTVNLGDGDDAVIFEAPLQAGSMITLDGGAGKDTFTASVSGSIIGLSDASLTSSGPAVNFGGTFEIANLTAGSSSDSINVSGWTGSGSIDGGDGRDNLYVTNDVAEFRLTDELLSRTGHGDLKLSHLEGVNLRGGAGDNRFDLTGGQQGTIDGMGGTDTVSVHGNDGSFVLSDVQLAGSNALLFGIARVEVANLTGGSSDDKFAVSGWSGTGTIDGAGGSDTVVQSGKKFLNYTVSDYLLTRVTSAGVHADLALIGIENTDITAPQAAGTLTLAAPFTGSATWRGLGGDDALSIDYASSMLPLSGHVTFIGSGGADLLNLTGRSDGTITWSPSGIEPDSGSLTYGDFLVDGQPATGVVVAYSGLSGGVHLGSASELIFLSPSGRSDFTMNAHAGVASLTGFTGRAKGSLTGGFSQSGTFTGIGSVALSYGLTGPVVAADDVIRIESLDADGLQSLSIAEQAAQSSLVVYLRLDSFALPVTGGSFSIVTAGHNSLVDVQSGAKPLGFGLHHLSLGGGQIAYAGIDIFDLRAPEIVVTGEATSAVDLFPRTPTASGGSGIFYLDWQSVVSYDGLVTFQDLDTLNIGTEPGSDTLLLDADGLSGTFTFTGPVYGYLAHFARVKNVSLDLSTGDGTAAVSDDFTVGSLNVPGLRNFTITTGAGDDALHLLPSLTSLLLPVPGGNFKFSAGAGNDTLDATADVSMSLRAGSLSYDGMGSAAFAGELILDTGDEIENAHLTGGASANQFLLVWTKNATVDAMGGNDSMMLTGFAGAGHFHGGEGDDTFLVQFTGAALDGAGAGAVIDGGPGLDTVSAQGDMNFLATDTSLVRWLPKTRTSSGGSVTNLFSSIENLALAGGNSPNLLDAGQFSGTSTLIGGGGVDNLIASKGGGQLYGFTTAQLTTAEMAGNRLYTRDNYFLSDGTIPGATDTIFATMRAANVVSFRYYQSAEHTGVNYALPDAPDGVGELVSASRAPEFHVALGWGRLTIVEGSAYGDRLTGNKLPNIISGLGGNDLLTARGVDILLGGAGADTFRGFTPFRFQDLHYAIPGAIGLPAVRPIKVPALAPAASPTLAARPDFAWLDPIASIVAAV